MCAFSGRFKTGKAPEEKFNGGCGALKCKLRKQEKKSNCDKHKNKSVEVSSVVVFSRIYIL